jgi:hypothetical protein
MRAGSKRATDQPQMIIDEHLAENPTTGELFSNASRDELVGEMSFPKDMPKHSTKCGLARRVP